MPALTGRLAGKINRSALALLSVIVPAVVGTGFKRSVQVAATPSRNWLGVVRTRPCGGCPVTRMSSTAMPSSGAAELSA